MLPQELIDILICPKCHSSLTYDTEKNILTCSSCGKIYEIKNDIPIMLIDEEENDQINE